MNDARTHKHFLWSKLSFYSLSASHWELHSYKTLISVHSTQLVQFAIGCKFPATLYPFMTLNYTKWENEDESLVPCDCFRLFSLKRFSWNFFEFVVSCLENGKFFVVLSTFVDICCFWWRFVHFDSIENLFKHEKVVESFKVEKYVHHVL